MNEGFGVSAADVSLLSTALPNVNVGGGCSAGALGLAKGKPPELVGAAAPPSLLVAPKRNAAGAEVPFCSSGFPKANGAATGSLSACEDPKGEPPCGFVVVITGPPSLANTDPAVTAVGLELTGVVSLDDATLSIFS